MGLNPPIIFYHKIDRPSPDAKVRGAFTSPLRFEKQLLFLKRQGYTFYTATELIRYYKSHGNWPVRGVAVTFDDGWKDNYTRAFPIMRRLEIRPTIFLVLSCIGRTTAQVTADGEGPREHLSADNIREMADFGVDFGSHSVDHQLLDRVSIEEVRREVVTSKALIESMTQSECSVFAYPAGFFNDAVKAIVRDAGYEAAFSTVYGKDAGDLFELNRCEILRRDRVPFAFARKITALG
ncbi:MAG TPA: polysaccharide deacetylase family protein [Pyrinomonadaceae bacterium]|jgi:peptidoglycan/xylan/chitin deacetylase (PgdA/CDA1 family)|nr:polysaccharide deacetylase family protein [Pyrinomonadaceae bacterium]